MLLLGTSRPSANTLTISGYVTDALRGTALSGVTITLTGGATGTRTTDVNGYYEFLGLVPSGNITVAATSAYTLSYSNLATATPALAALNIDDADRVRIAAHFSGTTLTGWPLVAADLNGTFSVESTDQTILTQILLGNTSYRNTYNSVNAATPIRTYYPITATPPAIINWSASPIVRTYTVTDVSGIFTASFHRITRGDIVV